MTTATPRDLSREMPSPTNMPNPTQPPRPAPPVGAPVRVSGAQSLVRSLEALGCEAVFGTPGGAILPAYDPLYDSENVRHILVRHEQGAGHAATGYAQATGKVGVCMATSGPGATNLVTPIADAHMDSVPLVAITGQVASKAIGTDAFQEADIVGITMPITKHNFLVTKAEEIPRTVAEAFHIASTGRPGPVLVDIAKDALQARTTFSWPPVMALGAFPDSPPLHVGMPGMHGSVTAVTALQKADLIVALGARFDDRVTGKLDSFAPYAKIVHADIDPAEIGKNRAADVPIVGDAREVIADLIQAVQKEHSEGTQGEAAKSRYAAWWKDLNRW